MTVRELYGLTKLAGKKTYNGSPVAPDETPAPFVVSEYEKQLQKGIIITQNLEHWTICGCHFTIGYLTIKKEHFRDYMKTFWSLLNEEIEPHRPGRCVIGTRADDSPKLCPKNNRCKGCEHYGQFPRYNPRRDAIVCECDYSFDDQEHDFVDIIHPEPGAALMEEATKDELIEHLNSKDRRYGKFVELRLKGYKLSEIFEAIGLKQSQGYNLFNKAKAETKKFWNL